MRVGAALSTYTVEGVDSRVLLLPIVGRSFLNELTLPAQIVQRIWKIDRQIDDRTWFETHELRLDYASREALEP